LALCSIALPTEEGLVSTIEQACTKLACFRPKKAVVIRAGALGACYALASDPTAVHWVPAYWTRATSDRVVDPTGAGNGFLGGLCAGLDEGVSVEEGESSPDS
jgi:sugar/nucleoside kinase (ribokinase family)